MHERTRSGLTTPKDHDTFSSGELPEGVPVSRLSPNTQGITNLNRFFDVVTQGHTRELIDSYHEAGKEVAVSYDEQGVTLFIAKTRDFLGHNKYKIVLGAVFGASVLAIGAVHYIVRQKTHGKHRDGSISGT